MTTPPSALPPGPNAGWPRRRRLPALIVVAPAAIATAADAAAVVGTTAAASDRGEPARPDAITGSDGDRLDADSASDTVDGSDAAATGGDTDPAESDVVVTGDEAADAVGEATDEAADAVGDVAADAADAVGDVADEAADVVGDAADEAADDAVQLINDLQDISFGRIAIIVFAAWLGIAIARTVLPYVAERVPSKLRLYVLGTVPIIRLTLLLTAILLIVPIVFNVTFQNFLVIAGAASVAIGFAFKDYVSSLIAGVVAIIERPYRPGDWVRIEDTYGEVIGVGMRAIRVRTPADDIVTIPHDKIWTANVANSNDGERTLLCVAEFRVAPDHDAEDLRRRLHDVALTSAYLNYGHPSVVMLESTPLGTLYKIKAYPFDMRDQFAFVSDLTVRGKRAIAEAGAKEISVTAVAAAEG